MTRMMACALSLRFEAKPCWTCRMAEVYHALGPHLHQLPGNLVAPHNQSYTAEFTLPLLSIIAFKPEQVEAGPALTEAKPVNEAY